MKKSKIIVPAMAMIAFSTAASIAGSVAWFTASRQASVHAGQYTVVKTNSNLVYDVTSGIGTEANNSTKEISLTTVDPDDSSVHYASFLTDGSFNHSSKKIFDHPNAAETALEHEYSLATVTESDLVRQTISSDGTKIFTAVTFGISFSNQFPATSNNIGLFLDAAHTTFTVAGTPITATGFRMAFVPSTASLQSGSSQNTRVLAKLQAAAGCSYVADVNDVDGTTYTSEDDLKVLIDSGYNTALPADGAINSSTALGRKDCLGVFGFLANKAVNLDYTVVCWFEGTDENIVSQPNDTYYQTVDVQLEFLAIPLAA